MSSSPLSKTTMSSYTMPAFEPSGIVLVNPARTRYRAQMDLVFNAFTALDTTSEYMMHGGILDYLGPRGEIKKYLSPPAGETFCVDLIVRLYALIQNISYRTNVALTKGHIIRNLLKNRITPSQVLQVDDMCEIINNSDPNFVFYGHEAYMVMYIRGQGYN